MRRLVEEEVIDDDLKRRISGMFSASRFNWGALERGDWETFVKKPELKTKDVSAEMFPQVLDQIDAVAKNPRHSGFRHVYAWLCEFVHPNIGSHLLFLKTVHERQGQVFAGFTTSISEDETIQFMEPFAGGIWSCLFITVDVLTQLDSSFVKPLEDWCDATASRYQETTGGAWSCHAAGREEAPSSALRSLPSAIGESHG